MTNSFLRFAARGALCGAAPLRAQHTWMSEHSGVRLTEMLSNRHRRENSLALNESAAAASCGHYFRLSEPSGMPHCHLGGSPVRYETPIRAPAHNSIFVRNQKVSVPVGIGPFTNGTKSQRKMPRNITSVSQPCQVAGTHPQPYAFRLNQYCSGLSFR